MALLPPVSIAWFLETYAPETITRESIDIWVLGAELIDSRDGGAWYQHLALLLGIGKVGVQLIGPDLPEQSDYDTVFRGTAEQYLSRENIKLPDVAVIFQPGFEEQDGLLASGVIARLLAKKCTVIGSSYSAEEYQRDRLMAQAYGYRLINSSDNPFALDPGSTGLRWADQLWQFSKDHIPDPDVLARPDSDLIDSVRCLSKMVAHSRLQGIWEQPAPPGSRFQIPDTKGGSRIMIHIMDSYYLDPTSGVLYGVDEGRLKPYEIRVSDEDIAADPAGDDPMLLALWAARIKSKYLVTGKKPAH